MALFSQVLGDAKLKYKILEKKEYSLVKYLNVFMTYILQYNIATYVPNTTFKDVLTEGEVKGEEVNG